VTGSPGACTPCTSPGHAPMHPPWIEFCFKTAGHRPPGCRGGCHPGHDPLAGAGAPGVPNVARVTVVWYADVDRRGTTQLLFSTVLGRMQAGVRSRALCSRSDNVICEIKVRTYRKGFTTGQPVDGQKRKTGACTHSRVQSSGHPHGTTRL
jgi:hypothetical protein